MQQVAPQRHPRPGRIVDKVEPEIWGWGVHQSPKTRDWLERYNERHQHPVNRACHTVGIPMIVVALLLGLAALAVHELWMVAAALFVAGWVLQFIGHWVEGKPPAFLSDWRFLITGLNWWAAKLRRGRSRD
jgi:uncharacterized membrane protein YGL010W